MEHRNEARQQSGLTDAEKRGLACGRKKGTNNRTGYNHKESSKQKISRSHKKWCKANPEKVKARGLKTRGAQHYNWKGGSARLNTAIRRLTEHRKWMDAVKERDGCCLECGATEDLESHHVVGLALLVAEHRVQNRDDARNCKALWDIGNGETLCQRCHCKRHGRKFTKIEKGRRASKRKNLRQNAP